MTWAERAALRERIEVLETNLKACKAVVHKQGALLAEKVKRIEELERLEVTDVAGWAERAEAAEAEVKRLRDIISPEE